MNVMAQTGQGAYANTGHGPHFSVLEFGDPGRVAVVEPDTAYWALVERSELPQALGGTMVADFQAKAADFREEMDHLRHGLKLSAVYLNPTERCNLNCGYCYLPEEMRKNGIDMGKERLLEALGRLLDHFRAILPAGVKPQLIFHGSEPMVAREAMFAGIARHSDDFRFGIQTNGTLLDDSALAFLKEHRVGIGLSLDAPAAEVANTTRKNWGGTGFYDHVVGVIKKLGDYPALNVITTVTTANLHTLTEMVDFYHGLGVRVAMMNPVRCTRQGGVDLKPDNQALADSFFKALDRSYELFQQTGRKLVIANFANVLAGVVGPTGRRLMCDISPCGGGRCFFAVAADGAVVPCSEFIGMEEFKGGNIFTDHPDAILASQPFREVTSRMAEKITPCAGCAIRHFCGAPCPAEVFKLTGDIHAPSPYCSFFEEQVRYAFRVIAQGREEAFLWDSWQEETEQSYCWQAG
ncbi:MAG: peptide-modifying radical SAM enzyme CbpB [Thermodesulfobacteriota bacterium]